MDNAHQSDQRPYAIRVKVPSGTKVMPHAHAENRIHTVISGEYVNQIMAVGPVGLQAA